MKKILFIIILLKYASCFAGDDILKVRGLYYRATTDKNVSDSFSVYLKTIPEINNSLLKGYTGMSYMIKANHSWNPYNKLSFFVKGKDYLNNAIEKDPKNVELRFLRFCVQTNAPGFLAYSGDITVDKTVIISGYSFIKDEDLKERIKNYMRISSSCTDKEKAYFK